MAVASPVKQTPTSPDVAPSAGAAGSALVDCIPLKMVMMLASPYIAGRHAEAALSKAHKLYKDSRFASTIDILGEDAVSDEDCDQSVKNYKQLLDMVSAQQIPARRPEERITVSFKPSMFSIVSPASSATDKNKHLDRAAARIEAVVSHARDLGVNVTLEAEDHRWTAFHLDTYFALINAGYANLGTVIQSRLFRTKKDLARFDERCRVRMVIGIYNESAEIAYTEKPTMKELAVDYACELLSRGTYVELASHDENCLKEFFKRAVIPQRAHTNRFETQYLLGVPRAELQRDLVEGGYFKQLAQELTGADQTHALVLADEGVLVRMYLPYGTENVAGPYCKRRLKANPNMMLFGIKNLLHLK